MRKKILQPITYNLPPNLSSGFSLLEILVACAIILVAVFSIMSLAQKSVQFSRLSLDKTQASFLLEEGAEAVKSMRDASWTNISTLTTGLNYYLAWNGTAWTLSTSNDYPTGQFTRTISVADVYRTDTDDIVTPVVTAPANDTSPPAIVIAPTATLVASSHAQVHWTTNEPGNSQIRYGTTSHAKIEKEGNSALAFLRSLPALLSATASNALSVWNASPDGRMHSKKIAIAGDYEYSTGIDSNLTKNHTITLYSLVPGTTYYYRTYSRDAAGNLGISDEQSFATASAPDTTAPTVSLTAPIAGTVSGVISVSANATDNVGIDHVDFYLGSTLIGGDAISPYSLSLNTALFANGANTFTAKAYDASGNSTVSSAVSVTISNAITPPLDTTPPVVSLIDPSRNATVGGIISISANATDDSSVAYVDFYYDSTFIDRDTTGDALGNFSILWDTSTLSNNTYSLSAAAYDINGNVAHSTSVSVTVSNASSGFGSGTKGTPLDPTTYLTLENMILTGAPLDADIDAMLQEIINKNSKLDANTIRQLQLMVDYGAPLNDTTKNIFLNILASGTPVDSQIVLALQNMIANGMTLDLATQQALNTVIGAGGIDKITQDTLQYMIDTGAQLEAGIRDTLQCLVDTSSSKGCSAATPTKTTAPSGAQIIGKVDRPFFSGISDYFRSYIYTKAEATGTQTLDPGTKLITVVVAWTDSAGTSMSKTLSFYLADIFD